MPPRLPPLLLILLVPSLIAVDRGNFKTCEQSGFCKRHRAITSDTGYRIVKGSVKFNESSLEAVVQAGPSKLKLSLVALEDSTVRLVLDELEGIRARYQPLDALNGTPKQAKLKTQETSDKESHFITADGHKVVVIHDPFRIDSYSKDMLVLSVNAKGLLHYEHFEKKEPAKEYPEGFWEETWKSHKDTKPHGSSSVGVDITFVDFKHIFGLPEHAESFALRSTADGRDPYRLYNLDVFEYELNNGMALYGSIPYVATVNPKRSVSALWLNAAETWVDVTTGVTADKGPLKDLVETPESTNQITTRFISESGLIDVFFFLGPRPHDLFRQYSTITGVYPLPPLFAIAYHQCRWNYNDEEDVAQVHAGFDEHDIPVDVIWLDIEHTDAKKYFTWDPVKFPTPQKMIDSLAAKGRKMVTIIDPHLKKDDGYHVYKDAKDAGYFIKNADGTTDFEGHCWPGTSSYLDFVNPVVRDYWAGKFDFSQYVGSTKDLFTWNDMNEPSVFSGPEVTMPKDAIHFGGLEHREVHNIYGFYQHQSTRKGQIARTGGKLRPFVLTRSFFVGSQRSAAVWTGDNMAEWSHLKASVPMLLSLSVAGVPHVGADVGGFFKNPDAQLLVRWYQAAAFQPFFRAHAHIDCKRREPWLFDDEYKNAIREAVRRRYTLFYEHSLTGKPVMRPLWLEFPEDESGYDEDREWLVGRGLLVRPIMEPDKEQISLYLPGRREVWYEWDTSKPRPSPGAIYWKADLNTIPVMQLGGTIIPTRERIRRASGLMKEDPITLWIALNMKGDFANGTIYFDDGESFEYEKGEFAYWAITFKQETKNLYVIKNKRIDKKGTLDNDVYIERIVVRGVKFFPSTVHIYVDDLIPEDLEFTHNREEGTLEIRDPGGFITKEFRIDIHC